MPTPSHPLVKAELPASVRIESGEGGLPRVRVASAAGDAEVYLHGAQVTGWTPADREPVIWMSRASTFSAEAPIRGGVPICFPWFSAHPTDQQAPAHGFARLADWALVEATESDEGTRLAFRLTDSEDSRGSAWPHRFEATYRVSVGPALVLALEVTNRDSDALTFQEALHAYFAVRDIREVTITGLEEASYLDRLAGPEPVPAGAEPIRIGAETDRIYLDTTSPVTIVDPGYRRAITISKVGSRSTVVWNPWVDKARAMRDFGDDEWARMVCVETGNVGAAEVRLEPGSQHTMIATIVVTDGE